MKKLILILVLNLMLLAGCGLQSDKSLNKNIPIEPILETCRCKGMCYGLVYSDACLFSKATHPQNCVDFVGILTAHGIYGSDDKYFTETDKDTCFKELISRQNNSKICPDFPDKFEYICFNDIGKRNLNSNDCMNLPYSYKSDCYLYISENSAEFELSLCDGFNHSDKITCYANKATTNNDSSICLLLEEDIDKINCYSQMKEQFEHGGYLSPYYIWFKEANFKADMIDESYCTFEYAPRTTPYLLDKWDYPGRNYTCYMALAMYHGDLDECYVLPREFLGIDAIRNCLFYTALVNNFELSDCDKYGIDYKECQRGVVLSKRDYKLCAEIYEENSADYDRCVYDIATDNYGVFGKTDILLCGKIARQKQECIEKLYLNIKNKEEISSKEVCKILYEIPIFTPYGDRCFYNLAIKKLDLSLCDEIVGDEPLKKDCKERIQHAIE